MPSTWYIKENESKSHLYCIVNFVSLFLSFKPILDMHFCIAIEKCRSFLQKYRTYRSFILYLDFAHCDSINALGMQYSYKQTKFRKYRQYRDFTNRHSGSDTVKVPCAARKYTELNSEAGLQPCPYTESSLLYFVWLSSLQPSIFSCSLCSCSP